MVRTSPADIDRRNRKPDAVIKTTNMAHPERWDSKTAVDIFSLRSQLCTFLILLISW